MTAKPRPSDIAQTTQPSLRLIGSSMAQKAVTESIKRYAPLNTDITLLGATGTGKTTIAKYIHDHSRRASGPWVEVNITQWPETLIERELFGNERGAFTGAQTSYKGFFEQAHGGTLFLDEIGELPHNLQAKLLKAIESKVIRRLGGTTDIECDVRIIYATHRELSTNAFREDFRFRIDRAVIRVPSLADRLEDMPELIPYIFELVNIKELGRTDPPFKIQKEAIAAFCDYDWPGNLRELYNIALKVAVARIGIPRLEGVVDSGVVLETIAANRVTSNSNQSSPLIQSYYVPPSTEYATPLIPNYITNHRQEPFDIYADRLLVESVNYLLTKGHSQSEVAQLLKIERTSLYRRYSRAKENLKRNGLTLVK